MNTRFVFTLLLALAYSSGTGSAHAVDSHSTRIILVGDSTMASETGYGDALCKRLHPSVTCLNMAKGGRSSGSYRAEGSWSAVQAELKKAAPNQTTYVLIQFGHNDQPGKPGRSTDLQTEFPVNMKNYVLDVRAAGAVPVLVTPLVRREFKDGVLQNNLLDWANATRLVGKTDQVPVLELNADSFAAVQKMGADEADTLAMAPPPATPAPGANGSSKGEHYRGFDHTHVGAKGASLFSAMVAKELLDRFPGLQSAFVNIPVAP